ncbi:MAG: LysM peptidoglycan-binding domain-containing protein [Candidatus Riflebacteria bacterium]|nr:LysM peptidoglycan-binding domain-containing protein [Candidatus Riflebacteria bacterium]
MSASKRARTLWVAIGVGLLMVIGVSAARAEDAGPSDFEVASLAPKDAASEPGTGHSVASDERSEGHGGEAASPGDSDARSKEVYQKNVERVKRIKSLFSKLKDQVESMQSAPGQMSMLPSELPPEAMDVDSSPVPEPGSAGSVLDEQPPAPRRGKKGQSAPRQLSMSAGDASTYTIQKGDTLAKIAKKLLGSAKKANLIAQANGLAPTDPLQIGRELVIPHAKSRAALSDANLGDVAVGDGKGTAKKAKGAKSAKAGRKPKNPASEPVLDYNSYEFKMYVIKQGDSVAKIAKTFYENGGGTDLIKKFNKLGSDNALKPGEKLLIPLPKKKASDERYEKAKQGVF